MFKRVVAVFLLISLILFSSGCRTKEPLEPKEVFDGIVLKYYKMYDDKTVMEPFISEYLGTHPGLKIEYTEFDDFDLYLDTILNEMAEGEGPDIFSMQNTWFYTNFKKIAPLPSDQATIQDFESVFVDTASSDLIRTDKNGKKQIFALPMTVDTLALYYNSDHFADKLPSKGKPSDNWSDLMSDVQQLTEADNSFDRFENSGIALGRADNVNRAVDVFYLLLLQHGLSIYDNKMANVVFDDNQANVMDNAALNALDIVLSFSDSDNKNYSWNEYVASSESVYKEIDAFVKGEVSMIVGYSYTYEDIINRISVLSNEGYNTISRDSVKTSMMPQLTEEFTSNHKRVSYASYFAETVSRNSQYPDIAWDFLIFLTNKDNQESYFETAHKPTSRRDLIDSQSLDPIYGVFAKQIGFAESFPIVDYFEYKVLFADMIDSAADGGNRITLLRNVQNSLQEFLPVDGFYIEEVAVLEEDEL